jgi:hypothetical protein
MATTIVLKNSVTTTNTPTSLAQGEVAVNVTDKKVWVGNAATTPIQIVNGGPDGVFTSVTDSGLTNTRVTYAGAGGLLKDSASITTDGTTLTAAGFSGPVGATTASTGAFTTLTATNFNAASTFGFKNRIINGAMAIDQRNAGASGTAINSYTVDRWYYQASQASKGTWQQNAGSVTPPTGFINYLGFTSSSAYSVAAGDYFRFYQAIEGLNVADLAWGTANAKTVTLSFWVYSSLTGTFGGVLSGGQYYPFSYSIPTANTWTQISVTIAGSTSGSWVTTNSTGVLVGFSLGAGSTFSGTAGAWGSTNYISTTSATSVVGTNGATWYVTGVQLETGSVTTTFDYRDYGRELIMCQRYYQKTYDVAIAPGTNGVGGQYGGYAYNTTQVTGGFSLRCTMRTAPTITAYSAIGTSGVWSTPGNVDSGACSALSIGQNGFFIWSGSGFSSGTIAYGHWTSNAEL